MDEDTLTFLATWANKERTLRMRAAVGARPFVKRGVNVGKDVAAAGK